jgi:hypothetical protein
MVPVSACEVSATRGREHHRSVKYPCQYYPRTHTPTHPQSGRCRWPEGGPSTSADTLSDWAPFTVALVSGGLIPDESITDPSRHAKLSRS